MSLIDAHCHLTHGRLRSQLAAVLLRAEQAGVALMITAASDVGDSMAGEALARRHRSVFFTAGVHPHESKDAPEDYLARLEELARTDKNVAIGEIGLDYHYDFSPRDAQRRVFAEQLALADRLGKPAVIHTREAFADTLAVIADLAPAVGKLLFHSFTGDAAEVRRVLDLGAQVSFSGIATFKKTDAIRRAAALVPADRILIETDAPYLSPEPVRKMKVNEPANLVHVADCLAAARRTAPAAFAAQTTANAARFFALDTPP